MITRDYASQNISVSWDGVPFSAFKDDIVKVSFDTSSITVEKGMDGNVCYTSLPSPTLTVMFTLEPLSNTNGLLWSVVKNQLKTGEPKVGSLVIRDSLNGDIITGLNASIQIPSDILLGKTHKESERVWVFKATEAKIPSTIF